MLFSHWKHRFALEARNTLLEQENRRLGAAVEELRIELTASRNEVRRIADALLEQAGAAAVFHPRPAPPTPGNELRPVRRLRDWRREMEFLEAQAFARAQRPGEHTEESV